MGILSEMFDEEDKNDLPEYEGEFIAAGEYDSRHGQTAGNSGEYTSGNKKGSS